jgi:hypothetical protein
MGFELLISDKSHPAIGALELDTLVELSHSDNVLPVAQKKVRN